MSTLSTIDHHSHSPAAPPGSATPAVPAEHGLANLAQRLDKLERRFSPACPTTRARALRLLERSIAPASLWLILAWLDRGKFNVGESEARFEATLRLARAETPLLRCAAHRWLARLPAQDLRFDARARRSLGQAATRETGLMNARIRRLLRSS